MTTVLQLPRNEHHAQVGRCIVTTWSSRDEIYVRPVQEAQDKAARKTKSRKNKKKRRAQNDGMSKGHRQDNFKERAGTVSHLPECISFYQAKISSEAAISSLMMTPQPSSNLSVLLENAAKMLQLSIKVNAGANVQCMQPLQDYSAQSRLTGCFEQLPSFSGTHTRFDDSPCERLVAFGSSEIPDTAAAVAVAQDVAAHTEDLTVPPLPPVEDSQAEMSENAEAFLSDTTAQQALRIASDVVAQAQPFRDLREDALQQAADEEDADGNSRGEVYALLKKEKMLKYWKDRYSLWSKFDDGIVMDMEGWYSVTPEAIAKRHAEKLACDVVVDAFCGVGGDTVQLASTCKQVVAADICMSRLLLAKENAGVYGVAKNIDFLCADFLQIAPFFRADAVFLSPPWGGPSYQRETFEVQNDVGGLRVNYSQLLAIADSALHHPVVHSACWLGDADDCGGIACFLPKSTNLEQLSAGLPVPKLCNVERCVLNGRVKAITVYIGPCAADCFV